MGILWGHRSARYGCLEQLPYGPRSTFVPPGKVEKEEEPELDLKYFPSGWLTALVGWVKVAREIT